MCGRLIRRSHIPNKQQPFADGPLNFDSGVIQSVVLTLKFSRKFVTISCLHALYLYINTSADDWDRRSDVTKSVSIRFKSSVVHIEHGLTALNGVKVCDFATINGILEVLLFRRHWWGFKTRFCDILVSGPVCHARASFLFF